MTNSELLLLEPPTDSMTTVPFILNCLLWRHLSSNGIISLYIPFPLGIKLAPLKPRFTVHWLSWTKLTVENYSRLVEGRKRRGGRNLCKTHWEWGKKLNNNLLYRNDPVKRVSIAGEDCKTELDSLLFTISLQVSRTLSSLVFYPSSVLGVS